MAMTPRGWSISALAVELGRDRRTVAKLVADVDPIGKSGNAKLYRLADVIDAIQVQTVAQPDNYEDARTRKMAADAVLAEIEVAKARGRVSDNEVIFAVVGEEYARFRAKAMAYPDKLAPVMETTEGVDAKREELRRAMVEMLEELMADADYGPGPDAGGAAEGGDQEGEGS